MTSATIVGVVYFFAWRSPLDFSFPHAVAVLLLGLVATASGEYSREMLRKPFVIGRHMFSNGVRVGEVAKFNAEGYLTHSLWVTTNTPPLVRGEIIFRGECLACHTRDGYRPMKRLLAGRDREAIRNLLGMLHDYKLDSPYRAFMPPLVGTRGEIESLGDYLATLARPVGEPGAPPAAKPALAGR
jgi:mono/diheme cytochrome c family protein